MITRREVSRARLYNLCNIPPADNNEAGSTIISFSISYLIPFSDGSTIPKSLQIDLYQLFNVVETFITKKVYHIADCFVPLHRQTIKHTKQ